MRARPRPKGVADAINRLLQTLVVRCAKGEYILDRYYIGVIGYGGEIGLGFPVEALAAKVLQPVSRIGSHPLRIEDRVKRVDDGAGGLVEQHVKFPVWFEPKAQGKTPMCAALQAAHEVDRRLRRPSTRAAFRRSSSTSATARRPTAIRQPAMAAALRSLASQDGNVLLFNVHVSVAGERPILFPTDERDLPDDYARLLFRMSSPLPPAMLRQAQILETSVEEGRVGSPSTPTWPR